MIAASALGEGDAKRQRGLVIISVLAAFSVGCANGRACNTDTFEHLKAAQVDRVVANFQERRPSLEINEPEQISKLVTLVTSFTNGWRETMVTPSTLNGDIHFYFGNRHVDAIWISNITIGRGACYRDLKPNELSQLAAILGADEQDFTK